MSFLTLFIFLFLSLRFWDIHAVLCFCSMHIFTRCLGLLSCEMTMELNIFFSNYFMFFCSESAVLCPWCVSKIHLCCYKFLLSLYMVALSSYFVAAWLVLYEFSYFLGTSRRTIGSWGSWRLLIMQLYPDVWFPSNALSLLWAYW